MRFWQRRQDDASISTSNENLSPGSSKRVALATQLRTEGAVTKAVEVLLPYAEQHPKHFRTMGRWLSEDQDFDAADGMFQRGVDAGDKQAIWDWAEDLHTRGETSRSLEMVMAPGKTKARDLRVMAIWLDDDGRYGEADALFEQAISAGDTEARFYWAQALHERGNTGLALRLLQPLIEEQPDLLDVAHQWAAETRQLTVPVDVLKEAVDTGLVNFSIAKA